MSEELLRVVVARRGKVKPTEFRLRSGEVGLSMFRKVDHPGPDIIVAAVRAAGKQGELAVVEIPVSVVTQLGLRVVATLGGTPDSAVNSLHVEVRPTRWRRLVLWVQRRPVDEWFNAVATPQLAAAAKLLAEGE